MFDFDDELTVGVLGRGKEFFLVRIGGNNIWRGEVQSVAQAYGYAYCGLIEIKDGEPKVTIEPDADSMQVMGPCGIAFSQLIAECLKRKQLSVEFCERLYSLPDPRA